MPCLKLWSTHLASWCLRHPRPCAISHLILPLHISSSLIERCTLRYLSNIAVISVCLITVWHCYCDTSTPSDIFLHIGSETLGVYWWCILGTCACIYKIADLYLAIL